MSIPIEHNKLMLSEVNPLTSVNSGKSGSLEGSFDAMLNVIGEENSIQKSSNDDNRWASEYSQRVDSDEQSLSRESQKRKDQHARLTSRDQEASKMLEQRQQKARESRVYQEELSAQKKLEQERYLSKKESSKNLAASQQDRQSQIAQKERSSETYDRKEERMGIQDAYSQRAEQEEELIIAKKESSLSADQGLSREDSIEALHEKILEQTNLAENKALELDFDASRISSEDHIALIQEDALDHTLEDSDVVSDEIKTVLNDLLHQETEELELQALNQEDLVVANSADELLQHLIEKSNLFDMQLQEELAEKLSGQMAAIQSLAQQDLGEKSIYVAANSSDAASIIKQEMRSLTQPLGQLMGALSGSNEDFIASMDSEQLKFNQENELSLAQKNQQGRVSQRGLLQGQMGAQSLVQAAGIKADVLGFNAIEASSQTSALPKETLASAIQSLDTSSHSGAMADQGGLLGDSSNKDLLVSQNESKLQGLKGEGDKHLSKVSRQVFSRMVDIIERLIEQYKPPFDPAALRQLDIRVNDPAGQILMEIVQENNQIFVKATAPEGALGDLAQVKAEIENSLNGQGMELGSWDLQKADEKEDKASASGKNSAEQGPDELSEDVEQEILKTIQDESHLINREL